MNAYFIPKIDIADITISLKCATQRPPIVITPSYTAQANRLESILNAIPVDIKAECVKAVADATKSDQFSCEMAEIAADFARNLTEVAAAADNAIYITADTAANATTTVAFVYYDVFKRDVCMYDVLCFIHTTVAKGGIAVLRIDSISTMIEAEFIYVMAALFDDVALIKPTVTYATNSHRFLLCRGRTSAKLQLPLHDKGGYVHSCQTGGIPLHIITRIEEANVVFDHPYLDACTQIVNMSKSRNFDDKRRGGQKCAFSANATYFDRFKPADKANLFTRNPGATSAIRTDDREKI